MTRVKRAAIKYAYCWSQACFVLATGVLFTTGAYFTSPAVFAQSVDPAKMEKIRELYKTCGADVRFKERAEAEIVAAEKPIRAMIARRLEKSGIPADKVAESSNERAASYFAKVRTDLPGILTDCANAYANELEEAVSVDDVTMLIGFYGSETGKNFIMKQIQVMDAVQNPIGNEFGAYANKVREELKAGSPPSDFKATNRGAELAKIAPQKLALINMILAAGITPETLAEQWKKVMSEMFQSPAAPPQTPEEKKALAVALEKYNAAEIVRVAMTIAYDAVYSEAELKDIKAFFSEPKAGALNEQLRKTERSVSAFQAEKLKNASTKAMQSVLQDVLPQKTSGQSN